MFTSATANRGYTPALHDALPILGTVTDTAGVNSVTLATTAGSINEVTNDDAGQMANDMVAGSVILTATTGIGTTSRLDLNAPTVTLATTGTGVIPLREAAADSA